VISLTHWRARQAAGAEEWTEMRFSRVLAERMRGKEQERGEELALIFLRRFPEVASRLLYCCGATITFSDAGSRSFAVSAESVSARPKRRLTSRSRSTDPRAASAIAAG
jgi:hypothetical protein